jgi:hypothetical protein
MGMRMYNELKAMDELQVKKVELEEATHSLKAAQGAYSFKFNSVFLDNILNTIPTW